MTEHSIHSFDRAGEGNTQELIAAVVNRASQGCIQAIIVASISGKTAIQTAEQVKRPWPCRNTPRGWGMVMRYL